MKVLSAPAVMAVVDFDGFAVEAGFTTRHFPVVLRKTDDLLEVSRQRHFKKEFTPASGRFAFLRQVHGDSIAVAEGEAYAEDGFHHFADSDAILTNVPNLALLVMTADCLSVFLCGVRGERAEWAGLVHAGWRGTQKNITQKTVLELCRRSGLRPADVHAAFGPCIGAGRYEVGEEFQAHFPNSPHLARRDGRWYFDLAGENRRQLLEAGVPAANIASAGPCTLEDANRFYSFRREKEDAGRMVSFIRLKEN